MWLLDTNICIFLIRQKSPRVLDRLRTLDIESVGISSITLAELEYGVAKSAQSERNRAALAAFVAPLGVMPFDDAAAERYGAIRADLERSGHPIGSLDMLIAAHAMALGRTLVTHNEREFRRVRGLEVENWA
ncbi:type II toxin-antitoxin system VapC family toxin [Myxococcota bacterium]|nr:type II toxin-antitoxin system VapC family toxin [Myxococcota bacterium]